MSDTVNWLKKISASKAKVSFDLEEEEASSGGGIDNFIKPKSNAIRKVSYSSSDLSGMKVSHEFDAFKAGETDILVLDDVNVLNESGNQDGGNLISMALKEDARLKRLREVARHANGYSGFKAYEEEIEDSVLTFGSAPKPSKILQKYDFASSEFTDEPSMEAGFTLGAQVKDAPPPGASAPLKVSVTDFDTVHSSGISTIKSSREQNNSSSLNIDKERRRAKKLTKAFFADEPEMVAEPIGEGSSQVIFDDAREDDDYDMQRIISATRREHMKSSSNSSFPANELVEDLTVPSGKSFDTLIMSESIFNAPPLFASLSGGNEMVDTKRENDNELESKEHSMDMSVYSDDSKFVDTFSAEPLVRNGVASTLSLLKMRGINLQPRSRTGDSEKSIKASSDIKLEYFDQFGNKLNSKEAYKELSRKFHGKGPGKGKIEKMKRRRDETNKMESLSASDASQSAIVTNLRKQQVESGAPYMILSSARNPDTPSLSAPITSDQSASSNRPKIFGLQLKK